MSYYGDMSMNSMIYGMIVMCFDKSIVIRRVKLQTGGK
jgi:hypothetical protein